VVLAWLQGIDRCRLGLYSFHMEGLSRRTIVAAVSNSCWSASWERTKACRAAKVDDHNNNNTTPLWVLGDECVEWE
jgi:hypothetical protein